MEGPPVAATPAHPKPAPKLPTPPESVAPGAKAFATTDDRTAPVKAEAIKIERGLADAVPGAKDATPGAKPLASRDVFLAEFAAAVAQANSIHPCCVVFVVPSFVKLSCIIVSEGKTAFAHT